MIKSSEEIAKILDLAAFQGIPVPQISSFQNISLDQSYDVQKRSIERRYERGETFSGLKMGFTSEAKMQQMGVHDMIWGRLTNQMAIPNEGLLELNRYIHPRAEPEIAFLVSADITDEIPEDQLPNYIDGLACAIEIIDSRYENFKFSLEDVIADNCSSSAYILGSWHREVDITNLQIQLKVDGEISHSGNSRAILGNPWKSLQACTRLAWQYGQPIPKGSVILAGAATPAIYIKEGQRISADIEGLGSVAFHAK